jgi:hypothetical protein
VPINANSCLEARRQRTNPQIASWDSAGVETERPIEEWVELGVFAAAEPGEFLGKPLYVRMHRIRSGTQMITVTVPERPARGGVDPYNLLDWEEGDNIETIDLEKREEGKDG